MSTLSQFSGGGIKSIQRGTITFSDSNPTIATATITAVNTEKTILNYCGVRSGRYNGTGNGANFAILAYISLTSSTEITALSEPIKSGDGFYATVSYEVIEYF